MVLHVVMNPDQIRFTILVAPLRKSNKMDKRQNIIGTTKYYD